jgi:hypothetical protein
MAEKALLAAEATSSALVLQSLIFIKRLDNVVGAVDADVDNDVDDDVDDDDDVNDGTVDDDDDVVEDVVDDVVDGTVDDVSAALAFRIISFTKETVLLSFSLNVTDPKTSCRCSTKKRRRRRRRALERRTKLERIVHRVTFVKGQHILSCAT